MQIQLATYLQELCRRLQCLSWNCAAWAGKRFPRSSRRHGNSACHHPALGYRSAQTISFLLAVLLAVIHTGCDRNDLSVQNQRATAPNASDSEHVDGQAGVLVHHTTPAEALISDCVQQYRALRSYQDQATVELHYELDGQPMVDKAPLNVAWDCSGKLGLKVYSLTAGPSTSGRWHLKVSGTRQDLIGQVLSRHPPEELSFEWLLAEPIVRDELSVGLGGFPPQLDLLLSANPLSGLLQNATSLRLGSSTTIDQRACECIIVELQQLVYELFVDAQSKLLRRISLPTQNLPHELLAKADASSLKLMINFPQIQTNHAIAWSDFDVSLDPSDKQLTQFVPRPPEISTKGYGKITPAFQLREPSGQIGYDSRPKPARKASVLLWLADHPSCRYAAAQSTRALQSLADLGLTAEEVEFVSVWAEPKAPGGMSFDQLKSEWQLPGRFVLDQSAAGRDLFGVEEAPTVVILDAEGVLQLRDVRSNPLLDIALPTLIRRIADGENLAVEIQQAKINSQRRFQAELEMAAVDGLQSSASPVVEYLPEHVRLSETDRKTYGARLDYLLQDPHQVPWVLMADGTLNRLSNTLAVEKSYPTSWSKSPEHDARILPSPDGRLIAHLAQDVQSRIPSAHILDTRTGQESQVALPENCRVVDMRWLIADHSNRLAIVTDSKHLIVFDWATQQRLIGNCPQKPIAIIDSACGVVLEDGKIEPIAMDQGRAEKRIGSMADSASASNGGKRKLPFKPLSGTWASVKSESGRQSIATGFLEKAEPALFFLDSRMEVTGHCRLPVRFAQPFFNTQVACAQSPGNGQMMWAILEENGTVYLVRGDAGWSDHFLLPHPIVGICLIPSGDRLKLMLASREEVIAYQLD